MNCFEQHSFLFQYAAYVAKKTSTHGSCWFASLAPYPKTQVSMFLFLFTIQIFLFAIFVQQVILDEHTETKTSMGFIETEEVEFPRITICSSTFYSAATVKSNILHYFISTSSAKKT